MIKHRCNDRRKEAAKSKVDEEVIKAKHGIDQAKTNNDVDQVEQNSTTMINNIQPTVVKNQKQDKQLMI